MSEEQNNSNKFIKITGILFLCYYLLAAIFPKVLWGGHHISFLPIVVQVIIFFLAGYFILIYPNSKEKPLHESILKPLTKLSAWQIQLAVSICFGVVFYTFPIHFDVYGDAAFLFTENDVIVQSLDNDEMNRILSFDFSNPKLATETTISLMSWLSYSLEVPSRTIFKLWDSIWGLVFVFLWVRLVTKLIKDEGWKAVLVLLGCTSSFLQLYFGHFEIYAPVFTGLLLYLNALLSFYESPNIKKLVLLAIIFLFCFKFHITSLLLVPTFFITIILFFHKDKTKITSISPKWILKFLLVPVMFLGLITYFYFGSFSNVRSFTAETLGDVVFLPVYSTESAPLDRYNLFSLYHIFDFGNMIILWSSAAIFVIISLFIGFRKSLNWNSPILLLIVSTLVIQVGFFFLFNPLLSMPNDWDILSIPVVTLLILILLIVKEIQIHGPSKQVIGTVFALSFFSVSVFVVNNNQSALSHKLQKQGEWEYQTYWIGSSTSILAGVNLEEDVVVRNQRLASTIEHLEPYAIVGNDIEYAELLHQKGLYYYQMQDYDLALSIFDKADSYSTFLCKNHYYQLLCNFMLGDYMSAHAHSEKTVICEYPTEARSYEIALHTALEAGDLKFADSVCNLYLTKWPANTFIADVRSEIKGGKNPKAMFASNWTEPKNDEYIKDSLDFKNAFFEDSLNTAIHLNRDTAILGSDQGFSALLNFSGNYYFDKKNYVDALSFYNESAKYSNENCEVIYQMLICNFLLDDLVQANKYCDQVISCEYPTPQKAYRVAIHTAVEGQYFGQAEEFCTAYLELWPMDEFIESVQNAIINNENPVLIKSMFKQN
ncbi:MAG: tetratricopeptide (TPR) repeat protein [Parvicella sp.]|jgi:tetratricopeptide (TPR) repeat protein